MNVLGILAAAAVVGITALIIGLLLGIAGRFFRVEVNEKEVAVREVLPGNNCGACGYPGCDGLAAAIATKKAAANACPVGGDAVAQEVAKIMGVAAGKVEKKVAYVKCAGTCDKAVVNYHYYGINDCRKAATVPGKGPKQCNYGCMGMGSCVDACPFDAIHVVNGVAVVEKEACRACGKCIEVCPNHLIELIPYKAEVMVGCNSKEKGKVVKAACGTGCIGCGICAKNCPEKAIQIENNLAHINQALCTGCKTCAEKCPTKAIKLV